MKSQQNGPITVTDLGDIISVFIPIAWKRTGGRKQIILPDTPREEAEKPSPLQIALARAYVWQKWIDEGKYANAKELSAGVGLDPTLVGRVLRLSRLAPATVEAMLASGESARPLQALLDEEPPVLWGEQAMDPHKQ